MTDKTRHITKSMLSACVALACASCATVPGDWDNFEKAKQKEAAGDRAAAMADYKGLIRKGVRSGEFGLAMMMYQEDSAFHEVCALLVSCAEKADESSIVFPDTTEDSAVSAAAMIILAEIFDAELGNEDVAEFLRSKASSLINNSGLSAWSSKRQNPASPYYSIAEKIKSFDPQARPHSSYTWKQIKSAADGQLDSKSGALASASRVKVFERNKNDSEFSYSYAVEFSASGVDEFALSESIKRKIERMVKQDYMRQNASAVRENIRVSFPDFGLKDGVMQGNAVALVFLPLDMSYNSNTGIGSISVQIKSNNMNAAREWAMENIGALISGRNVAVTAGERPPAGAKYRIDDETVTPDGLMKISFRTLN